MYTGLRLGQRFSDHGLIDAPETHRTEAMP
jgi:hypothetical protein